MTGGWSFHGRVSTAFRILVHPRRRAVVHALRRWGSTATPDELAAEVAALERDAVVSEVPAERRERVHLSLSHTHVPKLVGAEFLRYDREEDRVTLTERVAELDRYLDRPLAEEWRGDEGGDGNGQREAENGARGR